MARAPYSDGVHISDLDHPKLDEVSGMTSSLVKEDLLWLANDSDHEPVLFAARTDGSHLGSVRVAGVKNRDWEDLSSFRLSGVAHLLIADVGDNEAERDDCALHFIKEPEIGRPGEDGTSVDVEWSVRFQYEDGPRDCEAVAVDVAGNRILLVSKRDVPAVLYHLPLTSRTSPAVARRLCEVSGIPRPSPMDVQEDPIRGRDRSQVTSMDIRSDGRAMAILTYKHAYLYQCAPGKTWTATVAREPLLLVLPKLRQGEALCYSFDGNAIYITSEGRPAPLYRLSRKGPRSGM